MIKHRLKGLRHSTNFVMESEAFRYLFWILHCLPPHPPSKRDFSFWKTGRLRRHGRPKRKCVNNIDVDLTVIESGSVILIHLSQIIDQESGSGLSSRQWE